MFASKIVFLIVSLIVVNIASAETNTSAWVQGSWVNVRTGPQSNATVVTHWVVNTPAQVLNRSGDWCAAKAADNTQGFIKCKLLGDKALTLEEVSSGANADPMRAFWIAPSLDRLIAVGNFLREKLLTEQQKQLEYLSELPTDKPAKLIRYPVPEFEAMKQVLIRGVSLKPEVEIKNSYTGGDGTEVPILDQLLKQHQLKPVKPSLFKKKTDVVIATANPDDLDSLAALTGGQMAMRVLRGPRFRHDYDGFVADGFWDVGAVEVTLQKPVVLHVIAEDGLVSAAIRGRVKVTPNGEYAGCRDAIFSTIPEDAKPIAGYPVVTDNLLGFYLPKALDVRKAKITKRAVTVKLKDGMGELVTEKALLRDIDINSDGIPDFSVWRGPTVGAVAPLIFWKAIFMNVAGTWEQVFFDSEADCT